MLSAFWGDWRIAEHKFLFQSTGTLLEIVINVFASVSTKELFFSTTSSRDREEADRQDARCNGINPIAWRRREQLRNAEATFGLL